MLAGLRFQSRSTFRHPQRPPERIEVAVYYIVAEALTNIAKHAQASAAVVNVRAIDGVVRVSVSDDGVGGADPSRGSGLVGLRDRVDTLGGTINAEQPSLGDLPRRPASDDV